MALTGRPYVDVYAASLKNPPAAAENRDKADAT